MALVVKDRVKETTSTTGSTDAYNLAGAVTGFQTFDSALSDGDTTYYCCTDGTDFEVGRGTFTASGTTLARTTVLESSNSNNPVNWSSGTRDIFITQPAEKAVFLNDDGDIQPPDGGSIKLTSTAGTPAINIAGAGPNIVRFHDASGLNSQTNAIDVVYRTSPNDLLIERSENTNIIAEFGGDDGHAALYFDDSKKLETLTGGVDITGDITVSGTVDGRDVATDGTKLDGIEASADVTDTTNVTAAGALMDSEVTNLAQVKAFDSSDYATAAQGSTADSAMQDLVDDTTPQLGGNLDLNSKAITGTGHLEPVAGTTYTPPSGSGSDTSTDVALALRRDDHIVVGHSGYIRRLLHVNSSGDIHVGHSNTTGLLGNVKIYPGSGGSTEIYHKGTNLKIDTTDAGIDVTGNIVVSGTVDGRDVATDGTKLDGIEAGADVTDTANVTAAGALMDSEVTNLAQVKAFDSSDYATAAQGTTADAAMPKAGGAFTGDVTFTGTNYNVVWDKSDSALELADNAYIKVGAGDDMTIRSDGTYPRIKANDIIVESNNADQAIYFRSNDTGDIVDFDSGTVFYFQQYNDNNEMTTYNRLLSISLDVTDGSEDGRYQFQSLKQGANTNTFIIDPYYVYLMAEQQLVWYQYNSSFNTNLAPLTPTADRLIRLPDRDGVVQVVDRQVMTSNLAVGWHTIAVFQGRDDSPQGANQRFHAKFTLLEYTSSRHQAFTFYAQSMFGQDEGLQVIGNSTFGTDVVTAIRIKSSTDSNGLYAGAAIQVYVANATNNLILYLDEADFDGDESGGTYGNVILKTGVADASDPGDVGYLTASWSTFAEDVQIGIDSIEPGGIAVTGNLLTQSNIVLEGATADAHETIITATDATADRTITLPNATGTVLTTGNSDTPTTTTSSSDADFVLVDDGGTMKKITPANLGITAGAASTDDATALAIALG